MRLNLGSGPDIHRGWVNVDREPYDGLTWQGDVLDGLPIDAGDAEAACAHHVLQMVPWPHLVPWLREVRRVVRPGGALRLSVPDIEGAFYALNAGKREWFPIDATYEPTVDGAFCMYVLQAGATRSIFTEAHLRDLCIRAGWSDAWRVGYRETRTDQAFITDLDNRPGESLFIEAR